MKHGWERKLGWLVVLGGALVVGGCGPELRPDDTATRSLAPRGTYEKLAPASRTWSGDAQAATAGG